MTKSASAKKTPAKKSKKINLAVEPTPGATVQENGSPAGPFAGLSKKERHSVRSILKLATLDKVTKLSAKEIASLEEPTDKAVQEFIASAREIVLDLAHGSWLKKARALKAGDLKLALLTRASKRTPTPKPAVSPLPLPESFTMPLTRCAN
jgi:hypothetical protein